MRLLLHLLERLHQAQQSSLFLETRLASQILNPLFQPNRKQTSLASRLHLHLPNMQTKRDWKVVREEEAEAVNEARAIVAIIAGTGNLFGPGEIVENETGIEMLGRERVETAMIVGATIRGIAIISAAEIVEKENGMTGVGVQAETVHVLVLEIDEEPATVHVAEVERGENVPVVAIGYVLQVLLPETLSSKNGS